MKKIIYLLIFISLSFLVFLWYFPVKYMDIVEEETEVSGIETEVILSLIKVESGFREKVVSRKGAVGLMQVLPETAKWISDKEKLFPHDKEFDLYDYRDNIKIGTAYFKYLNKKYDGDLEKILAAYNAGTNRVKTGKWKQFRETIKYVNKIRVYRYIYKVRLYIYEKSNYFFTEENYEK